MANKGIRTYSGAEPANIQLGQTGMDVIKGTANDVHHAGPGTDAGVNYYHAGTNKWVIVKCYLSAGAGTPAYMDITLTDSDGTVYDLTNIPEGESFSGDFTKITLKTANSQIVAVRG